MKKLIGIFLCGCMLLATSACKSEKPQQSPSLNKLFTCTAEMEYDDFKASATMNRLGNGLWDVEFSAPKTLKGVKLSYSGEEITASYLGFAFTVPKTTAPVKNMLTLLFSAVDKCSEKVEMPCTVTDGVTTYTGESVLGTSGSSFKLSLDKDEKLVSFAIPDEKLMISFSDYTAIQ